MFRKELATITLQSYRLDTLFLTMSDILACTVTCRQFPNLTFAPRKTCHVGSNLTLHRYHATALDSIHDVLG